MVIVIVMPPLCHRSFTSFVREVLKSEKDWIPRQRKRKSHCWHTRKFHFYVLRCLHACGSPGLVPRTYLRGSIAVWPHLLTISLEDCRKDKNPQPWRWLHILVLLWKYIRWTERGLVYKVNIFIEVWTLHDLDYFIILFKNKKQRA